MNEYNQRDIVLVDFPFSNKINSKVRPAVIISNNDYNKKTEDYLLVGVSSSAKDNDYSVSISSADLVGGKLKLESKIKCDHLFLMAKEMIRIKIAIISDELYQRTKNKIITLINT